MLHIRETFRDREPRIALQLINRVANRLSREPRTAGSVTANWTAEHGHDGDAFPDGEIATSVLYSLGKNYRGEAKRKVKSFVKCIRRRMQSGRRVIPL